jgi:hypothetical protein
MRASRWIGRPFSSISIVTIAICSSGSASTLVTFPTCTPAIRTGERVLISWTCLNTALSSYGLASGFALVNAKKVAIATRTTTITPAPIGPIPSLWRLPRGMSENGVFAITSPPAGCRGR